MEIGDFAWRYEELLNSLIEARVEFSQSLAHGLTLAAGADAFVIKAPPIDRLTAVLRKMRSKPAADAPP